MARRVTEVAQSTLEMVTNAVDYPLCEYSCPVALSAPSLSLSSTTQSYLVEVLLKKGPRSIINGSTDIRAGYTISGSRLDHTWETMYQGLFVLLRWREGKSLQTLTGTVSR